MQIPEQLATRIWTCEWAMFIANLANTSAVVIVPWAVIHCTQVRHESTHIYIYIGYRLTYIGMTIVVREMFAHFNGSYGHICTLQHRDNAPVMLDSCSWDRYLAECVWSKIAPVHQMCCTLAGGAMVWRDAYHDCHHYVDEAVSCKDCALQKSGKSRRCAAKLHAAVCTCSWNSSTVVVGSWEWSSGPGFLGHCTGHLYRSWQKKVRKLRVTRAASLTACLSDDNPGMLRSLFAGFPIIIAVLIFEQQGGLDRCVLYSALSLLPSPSLHVRLGWSTRTLLFLP